MSFILAITTEECMSTSTVYVPHLITDETLPPSTHPQPCVQYWPEPGLQQYGPMEVEFLSMTADEDVVTRLFRVKNVTRVSHCSSIRKPAQGMLFHSVVFHK